MDNFSAHRVLEEHLCWPYNVKLVPQSGLNGQTVLSCLQDAFSMCLMT